MEVSGSRTKAKRKRRKSWTGPACRQDAGPGGGGGGGRKGHSLDQGYETTHHHEFASRLRHQHAALYRSFSGGGGDVGTVLLDGGGGGGDSYGSVPGTRQFRTPSVVVSDHSEDPPVSCSSVFTLDDLDELEPRADCGFNDSSSDCSAASTWSAAGSVISVLDADYSLHTPERKISGCSTCSTLSGEDEQDAAFRLSKSKPKVSSSWCRRYPFLRGGVPRDFQWEGGDWGGGGDVNISRNFILICAYTLFTGFEISSFSC